MQRKVKQFGPQGWKEALRLNGCSREFLRRTITLGAVILLSVLLAGCSLNPKMLSVNQIPLFQAGGGISLQEISYDEKLDRVIIPGGNTGKLFLIDPVTQKVETIGGFKVGSGGGVVSAVRGSGLGRDLLYVLDQNEPALYVVDPNTQEKLASLPLKVQGAPEYVRFIRTTRNEIWVTEPGLAQIEVFTLKEENGPALALIDTISVPGGPVGLIYQAKEGIVYTNRPAVGLTSGYHAISHQLLVNKTWGNGCTKARGLALGEGEKYLFVACEEGRLVMVNLQEGGVQVASQSFGDNLNQVSYSQATSEIYLPSGGSAIMGVFQITNPTPTPEPTPTKPFLAFLQSSQPEPTPTAAPGHQHNTSPSSAGILTLELVRSADTSLHANCVTNDKYGNVWICDPENGRILWVKDANN